ncbi:gamma-glutamylcyclotransferase [Sinorhizobium fredii]|uniref:gamma-glutamylcyclotransferase family protein n=1 Tax=Rhizobium fredii TaxID=380 RepID=UPI003518A0A2
MSSDPFITFAYGSNMPTARIRARCASARFVGVAELSGYQLRWHKKSKDGSGKCDIVRTDRLGASVFGVLYEIASSEKADLDRAEGLGSGYDETEIEVHRGAERLIVKAYVASSDAVVPTLKPYTWYRALAVAGAKEHGLPTDYIAGLESVPANDDPDRARHDRRMRLVGEVQA